MPDDQPVLVLISVDPRESHRANEAMRIALGIVSGENDVTVACPAPWMPRRAMGHGKKVMIVPGRPVSSP